MYEEEVKKILMKEQSDPNEYEVDLCVKQICELFPTVEADGDRMLNEQEIAQAEQKGQLDASEMGLSNPLGYIYAKLINAQDAKTASILKANGYRLIPELKVLSDEEIEAIFVDEFNLREAELLPAHPKDRNKHTPKNIHNWIDGRDWRLIKTTLEAQLNSTQRQIDEANR